MTLVAGVSQGSVRVLEQIREALDTIHDPCSVAAQMPMGLHAMGLIREILMAEGDVEVAVRLTSPTCMMLPFFINEIESRVGGLPGVRSVHVSFDSGQEWTPDMMSDEAKLNRAHLLEERYGPQSRLISVSSSSLGTHA
jgi:metal-sulfur cluster biosynthetic enzyme